MIYRGLNPKQIATIYTSWISLATTVAGIAQREYFWGVFEHIQKP
jgi:hypothetical protein